MSSLLLASNWASAQCIPPATSSLVPPQSSTALVLKWSAVSGTTQYQLRYWETALPGDLTIVDNCGPSPYTLRGLRKNTAYTLQVRTKCGNSFSGWGTPVNGSTINSSGTCNNLPLGVLVSAGASNISVSWTSTGSHTIRYRMGNSGDWLIPTGASTVMNSPFSITGLSAGTYQVEIKRNCSATAGNYVRFTIALGNSCVTPIAPVVTPFITNAVVDLPSIQGVVGYNVKYRPGVTGSWINGGDGVPPSMYILNPPLTPSTTYQVQIQAICNAGSSSFSLPTTFATTQGSTSCLANKHAGKNLNAAAIQQIDQKLNTPSPFPFGSMIGVNDGGLVFRSFQPVTYNQITELTTQFRNFHTMDEDFNQPAQSYDLNTKPKNTTPEGTPSFTFYNKGLYSLYRQIHGFTNITGALELLHYGPQTWKEKIYKESDWSKLGPAGIQLSFGNYTKKFIDEFAPANGSGLQILVSNYQVGNELWDYPIKFDYHSMLLGAHNAFVSKYGPKTNGGWKMKLIAGAFQAFRDNTCTSMLRDFSNCNGDLNRFDFIGDYLDLDNCEVLKDLDAIDCHPYSFLPGTTNWTYPEDPNSETWQIRNLAQWLDANKNSSTGVLANTHLWSTEYGFDSNSKTGVGEKTHSAYLLRGLLLHSRYHYEKVFFYNAFDVAQEGTQAYEGLYNSAGFWKQGQNGIWPSPLEVHGATPKPAWYGMLDFKSRFSNHVFYKALVEDSDAYVILIAKPDGSDPYLVFWSPSQTNDSNINQDIAINKVINWAGTLSGTFKVESQMAQSFAESMAAGQTFSATSGFECGSTTLSKIRRNPAFIRLVSCAACPNITNPGSIVAPNPNSGSSPFDPGIIVSSLDASGGSGGIVEYQWQQSVDNNNFINIPGATSLSYNPPSLTQTGYFRRAAKRSNCPNYIYTTSVGMIVANGICPAILTFQRHPHVSAECNSTGDNYYELSINQANANDQITLSGLPSNGLNISMSLLNGVSFTTGTFNANLSFVNNSTLHWQVKASNGSNQTLRLYYCWADAYPSPVNLTSATAQCSGLTMPCIEAPNIIDPGSGGRDASFSSPSTSPFRFKVAPNPGSDHFYMTYEGGSIAQATLRIMSATGQVLSTQIFSEVENQQQWEIDTSNLPQGIYFLCLQTGSEVKWVPWQRG